MGGRIYLYVTPFFPSPESWRGGYCYDAVRALMRNGKYDVRVFTGGDGPDYEYNGVRVHRFKRYVAPCGLAPFLFARLNSSWFLRKLKALHINLDEVAVCHVNTSGYANYGAAVKQANARIATLLHHHCSAPIGLKSGRLGIVPIHATLLYLYLCRQCATYDAHVFVSRKSRDTFGLFFRKEPEDEWVDVRSSLLLGRYLPPLKCNKAIVLYNGVDKSMFNPIGRPRHDGFVIGNVANFQPLKDQLTLVKAFSKVVKAVPEARLRLIGTGVCLTECRKFAEAHCPKGSVSFEPEVDHLELPDFYRSLDLFAFPSRFEGFACVCMESLACGTPFISCGSISSCEVLDEADSAKWLMSPKDVDGLAEKIIEQRRCPSQQKLRVDMSIDSLVDEFLSTVDLIRS